MFSLFNFSVVVKPLHYTLYLSFEEGSIIRQLDSKRQGPGAGDLESDAAFRPGSVSTRHLTL